VANLGFRVRWRREARRRRGLRVRGAGGCGSAVVDQRWGRIEEDGAARRRSRHRSWVAAVGGPADGGVEK
jgi:hypothetical protein